jgi:hypothetical protein
MGCVNFHHLVSAFTDLMVAFKISDHFFNSGLSKLLASCLYLETELHLARFIRLLWHPVFYGHSKEQNCLLFFRMRQLNSGTEC